MTAQRFYLDTNVFIVLVEIQGSDFEAFVERVSRRNASLITSEITLAELLVKPLQDADHQTASFYESLLTSGELLTVIPVDREILRASARLRSKHPSKLIDAIHVATAIHTDCSFLISSDKRMNMPASLRQLTIDQLGEMGDP